VNRTRRAARSAPRSPATRRWIAPVGLVAILMMAPMEMQVLLPVPIPLGVSTADAVHPFYERRLAEGTLALAQERPGDAARLLKIAAFGLLDDPPRLAEALVRLALARAEIGEPGAFRETLRRVAEIEERFAAYREAALSPAERSAFELRITELTPASELDRSPALQRLLQAPVAAEGGARSPTAPVPPAPTAGLSTEERERVERAREILARARQARDLDEARTLARPIADTHPARRDLQQLVGEIAYRSSRWEESARYLERGLAPSLESSGSPRPAPQERPELLFYLAVALFESGRAEEAKAPLELALPQLERTDFVRSYVEKILRPPSPEATSTEPEHSP